MIVLHLYIFFHIKRIDLKNHILIENEANTFASFAWFEAWGGFEFNDHIFEINLSMCIMRRNLSDMGSIGRMNPAKLMLLHCSSNS